MAKMCANNKQITQSIMADIEKRKTSQEIEQRNKKGDLLIKSEGHDSFFEKFAK